VCVGDFCLRERCCVCLLKFVARKEVGAGLLNVREVYWAFVRQNPITQQEVSKVDWVRDTKYSFGANNS